VQELEEDVLYHLALGSGTHDLCRMFGDVRFVCMGGTPQRMKSFAEYMLQELGYVLPTGTCLTDISERSHRSLLFINFFWMKVCWESGVFSMS
jgi:uridine phosphorylase